MTQPQVIQGTPQELQSHLKLLKGNMMLTLIVPAESEQGDTSKPLYNATPKERAQALDEIAAMNQNVPVLPADAYRRENLYEERF